MKLNYTFPVGIPSSWDLPQHYVLQDENLKQWLLDTGSLTERLKAQCEQFHLTLLGQKHEPISLEEFRQVSVAGQMYQQKDWQVREVILSGDNQPWVFARSIIPQSLCESNFIALNTLPLGQLIFNDKRFKRMPIEVTKLQNCRSFYQNLGLTGSPTLWGRRSVFGFENVKMMVSEVFLPDSPAYHNVC